MKFLLVFVGGGLGCSFRYFIQENAIQRWGSQYPYGTTLVNISGAFLIGFLLTWFSSRWPSDLNIRLLLITGFLGGFTTFSALTWEAMQLYHHASFLESSLYLVGSVTLGLLFTLLGSFVAAQL